MLDRPTPQKKQRHLVQEREPDTVLKPVPREARTGRMPDNLLASLRLMLIGGATDQEICTALHINRDTLYNWRDRSPQLAAMMQAYKDGFDLRIERSLAQSALGYTYQSEKIMVVDGKVERIPVTEYVQPVTAAQIFWLKNRQPWAWRDKHELDVTGDLQVTEVPDDRKLAMQMLALLREAANQPAIEHEGPTNELHSDRHAEGETGARDSGSEPSAAGPQGRRRRFA